MTDRRWLPALWTWVLPAALGGCGLGISQDRLLNTMEPSTWERVCAHKMVAFDSDRISYTCGDTVIQRPPIPAADRQQDCLETYAQSSTWDECTATWNDFRALLRARAGEIEVEAAASEPVDTGLDPRERPRRPARDPIVEPSGTITVQADPCRPQPLPTEVTDCVSAASP